jgi:hypothetical protein
LPDDVLEHSILPYLPIDNSRLITKEFEHIINKNAFTIKKCFIELYNKKTFSVTSGKCFLRPSREEKIHNYNDGTFRKENERKLHFIFEHYPDNQYYDEYMSLDHSFDRHKKEFKPVEYTFNENDGEIFYRREKIRGYDIYEVLQINLNENFIKYVSNNQISGRGRYKILLELTFTDQQKNYVKYILKKLKEYINEKEEL